VTLTSSTGAADLHAQGNERVDVFGKSLPCKYIVAIVYVTVLLLITSQFAGRLHSRVGPRRLMTGGLFAAGLVISAFAAAAAAWFIRDGNAATTMGRRPPARTATTEGVTR